MWDTLAFVVAVAAWSPFFTPPMRRWWLTRLWPGAADREHDQVLALTKKWRDELRDLLLKSLREEIENTSPRRLTTALDIREAPGLRRTRGPSLHVKTPAEDRLINASDGMDDGCVALCGPRGVGKTELLEAFCGLLGVDHGVPVGLSVVVRAPVAYDPREFVLYLYAEVCEQAMSLGSRALRNESAKRLRWIQYQQTRDTDAGVSATVAGTGLNWRRAVSDARQPPLHQEIVKEFKGFLTLLADHLEKSGDDRRRLLIGIDELDRIQPASGTREFLNEFRAIFDVPNCLLVLSVSDEALREAELVPLGRWEVFDHAVDEVIRVEPLDHRTAVKLLETRVIGLPEVFAALFNCLAGGIPRDLFRIARAAILSKERPDEEGLSDTAGRLVRRELHRIVHSQDRDLPPQITEILGELRADSACEHGALRRFGERIDQAAADLPDRAATMATIANRLFFLDTVLGVFSSGLTPRDIERGADPSPPNRWRSFTALAAAGNQVGTVDHKARSALQQIRHAWHLTPIPDIGERPGP